MFTIDQIQAAHAKTKSGKDLPAFIRNLKELGVTGYATYVADGHTEYYGPEGFRIQSVSWHAPFQIAGKGNRDALAHYLRIHQAGETEYLTFCRQAAETGVQKWEVVTGEMTCIYYDSGRY